MNNELWTERLGQVIERIAADGQVSDRSRANLVWLVDSACREYAGKNGFRREAKFLEADFVLQAADYRDSVWVGTYEKAARAILGLDSSGMLTLYNPDGSGIKRWEFDHTIVEHWASGGGGTAFQYKDTFKPHLHRIALTRIDLGRIITHDGDRKPAAALGYIVLDGVSKKRAAPDKKPDSELPMLPLWEEKRGPAP